LKVLMVGDSPLLKTGFGRVNNIVAKRFQQEGWDVASVGGLLKEKPDDDQGIKTYPPSRPGDVLGISDIDPAVNDFQPDVIYGTADPGSVTALAYGTPDMPAFFYTPIEGEPIVNRDWRHILSSLPLATCSAYGASIIQQSLHREVPWVYHGVNHDVFQPTGIRDDVRRKMHWEDKFVIICVATNVRRKQLPRLIEAVAQLKHHYKQKDIVLYLHTVPFQNYWLEGWNLIEVARMYDLESEIFFHPFMAKQNAHVSERSDDANAPGLVEMYQAADLFVLPSQVEGFGLPIAEAMACGTPVMVTKYAAGWEVASPAGVGIPVIDWEVHKSGTIYANVNTDLMAKEILRLKRDPKQLARMRQAGLIRAQDYRWEHYTDRLIPFMENAIESFKTSRTEKEEEDKGHDAAPTEEVSIRTVEDEDSAAKVSHILEGQG
jgi:glycosyltransferase involved in cell wall biosynthesis